MSESNARINLTSNPEKEQTVPDYIEAARLAFSSLGSSFKSVNGELPRATTFADIERAYGKVSAMGAYASKDFASEYTATPFGGPFSSGIANAEESMVDEMIADLDKAEKQRKRDECERWRVETLNAALQHPRGRGLYAMKGRRRFEFTTFDVNDDHRSRFISRGSSNIEDLTQSIIELEMVNSSWAEERYRMAREMARNWDREGHVRFMRILEGDKTELTKAMEMKGSIDLGDKAAETLDDGLELEDVIGELLGENPAAGTW